MIIDAPNRVPAESHWGLYREAEAEHEQLLDSLRDAIGDYVENLLKDHGFDGFEVESSKACTEILKSWPDAPRWKSKFGRNHRKLFGMAMWVFFFDDHRNWWTNSDEEAERKGRTYELDFQRIKTEYFENECEFDDQDV